MLDKIMNKKWVFSFLLVFLVMSIRCQAFAADPLQGAEGYGDSWSFDQDTGILTVYDSDGFVNANDFLNEEGNSEYKSNVEHLVLGSKVKRVIDYSFAGYENLLSITLPAEFESYMLYSFIGDKKLADIYYFGTEAAWKEVDLEERDENPPVKEGYTSDDIVKLDGLNVHYCTAAKPSLEKNSKGIQLTWDKTEGASGYEIYRKESGQKWAVLDKVTKTDYTDKTSEAEKLYTYKIRAIVNGMSTPFGPSQGISTVDAKATKITTIKNQDDGILVKWKKMAKAKEYAIYRKKGSGAWKWYASQKGKDLNKTFIDTNVSNCSKYRYKVAVVYKYNTYSDYSSPSEICRLSTPKITSVKNNVKNKLTVRWKKTGKVTGYEIKYVTGSTSKTVKAKGADTVSKTISSLKKGKTYKIYIRSYKTASGKKYYSGWSKVSKKKVK